MAQKRLTRELTLLTRSPVELLAALPDGDDLHNWLYVMDGPAGTPYAGGTYVGQLIFRECAASCAARRARTRARAHRGRRCAARPRTLTLAPLAASQRPTFRWRRRA